MGSESRPHLVLHYRADLPGSAGSECWVPVGGVPGSQEVFCQGQDSIHLLMMDTGTICSVLVPPAEPEAGRTDLQDSRWLRRDLLKTELQLLSYSWRVSLKIDKKSIINRLFEIFQYSFLTVTWSGLQLFYWLLISPVATVQNSSEHVKSF